MKQLIRHILREHTREIILEMPAKLTQDEFIKRSKKVHGDKYDYSKVKYIGTDKKVEIVCPKHGKFTITPAQHMIGVGCVECYREKYRGNDEKFIEKSEKMYGDKFDYSKVKYKNNLTKVKIGCPIHGEFSVTPHNFLILKSDCPQCKIDKGRNQKKNEFIKISKKVHKNQYDYSDVIYTDVKNKVNIICPLHGIFSQTPEAHMRGQGCRKCSDENWSKTSRMTQKEFIQKAKETHGKLYDYSESIYNGPNKKVTIICKKHGKFTQSPSSHIGGSGCPICSGNVKRTYDEFISDAKKTHGNKYDYSKVKYENTKIPVEIICSKHGSFLQAPIAHVKGAGCTQCTIEKNADLYRMPQDEFINRSNEVHGNKYDYSKVNYINGATKVEIICPKHGIFLQPPANHIVGVGCPSCNESRGEKIVSNILLKNNIQNIRQHKFIDCTNKLEGRYCVKLPFDFYLPNENACIEYDGRQHFEPVDIFGGENSFERLQRLDNIRNIYCKKNGIKLIRIPYTMKKEEIEPYILKELGIK